MRRNSVTVKGAGRSGRLRSETKTKKQTRNERKWCKKRRQWKRVDADERASDVERQCQKPKKKMAAKSTSKSTKRTWNRSVSFPARQDMNGSWNTHHRGQIRGRFLDPGGGGGGGCVGWGNPRSASGRKRSTHTHRHTHGHTHTHTHTHARTRIGSSCCCCCCCCCWCR